MKDVTLSALDAHHPNPADQREALIQKLRSSEANEVRLREALEFIADADPDWRCDPLDLEWAQDIAQAALADQPVVDGRGQSEVEHLRGLAAKAAGEGLKHPDKSRRDYCDGQAQAFEHSANHLAATLSAGEGGEQIEDGDALADRSRVEELAAEIRAAASALRGRLSTSDVIAAGLCELADRFDPKTTEKGFGVKVTR